MKTLQPIIIAAMASVNLSITCSAAEVVDDPPVGFVHISEQSDLDNKGEYYIQRNKITSVVTTEKVIVSDAEQGVSETFYEVAIDTLLSNDKPTYAFKFSTFEKAAEFVEDLLEIKPATTSS